MDLNAACANELTEHVLPDTRPFTTWRELILSRFERFYPLQEDGEVVPREAVDSDFEFHPELTEQLVQDYLSRLNSAANRFLRTPKEMLEGGCKGITYMFNIEEDRRQRGDW